MRGCSRSGGAIDAGASVVGSNSGSRSSPWSGDDGGGVRIDGALEILRVTGCTAVGSGRDTGIGKQTVESILTEVTGADFARKDGGRGVLQSLYRAMKDRSWAGERCADVGAGDAGTESDWREENGCWGKEQLPPDWGFPLGCQSILFVVLVRVGPRAGLMVVEKGIAGTGEVVVVVVVVTRSSLGQQRQGFLVSESREWTQQG